MKKVVGITTGVVVIAVAGWLGTTWYTGKRIEAEEPARLAQLNKELASALASTGFGVTIDKVSYDRHFFDSDVRYGIKLTKVPGEEAPPAGTLEIVGHIEHGPFAKSALARGQWMPKLAFIHTELASNDLVKPLFELTKGVSPLVADTILSYNGDGVGTAAIAPIEFSQDDQSVKFSGMQLEGSYVRATQHSVGTGKIGQVALNLSEDGQHVRSNIAGISLDIDSRMGQFGFGIGSSGLKIDSLTVDVEEPLAADDAEEPDSITSDKPEVPADSGAQASAAPVPSVKNTIALKDLGYNVNLGEEGTNVNVVATYSVGQIMVNDGDFGKGHATIKLDKIDGKSTKALADIYNQVLASAANPAEEDSKSDTLMLDAVNQAIALLAANPTLRIDPFVWETAKGQSNLNLAIELTKPAGLVAGQEIPKDSKQLLQQMVKLIDLKVSVSKPMVQDLAAQYLQREEGVDAQAAKNEAEEQVNSMAGMAEMFGIAKSDGDNLVGTFHYADGKANLNGEEVPADELFGALLSNVGSDDDDSDNTLLSSFDPNDIAAMISDAGYDYGLGTSDYDTPVLTIDGTEEGAQRVEILFNDCESETSCSDMQMRATVAAARAVPMRVFNEWNQNNRPTRAYWDADNKAAVLEMDLNAYGGVGQNNVQYTVNLFLNSIMSFADTMQEATRTSSKP